MQELLIRSKKASEMLKNTSAVIRSKAIQRMAELIDINRKRILEVNNTDIDNAQKAGLTSAMVDRLALNDKRLTGIINSLHDIAKQPDPVGQVLSGEIRPNGMRLMKLRVPLGVVGIIYESRPNVTVDCAALCLRSGNAAILRGGREAYNSNRIFADLIVQAMKDSNIDENTVTLLDDPDRSKMLVMLKAVGMVDLIVPRGGDKLIGYVTEHARVPVIKHDKGVCNIYVDKTADFDMAVKVINNAKVSRPSACNAVDCVLVDKEVAQTFLPLMAENLTKSGVELRGCERAAEILNIKKVEKDEWGAEYLDLIMAVRVVNSIDEAIKYITEYGSAHSDAIMTDNYENSQEFLSRVDSACVYVNASTRFTDGGEFGLGAEVGISTEKLHSRGPMGAFDLTTTKFVIYGDGHIRE